MKKSLILLICLAYFSLATSQEIEPAPMDKSVVYFVRPNVLGAAINFTFYDGDNLIGRFNGGKYMRYECDPGDHIFWARSENRSYVKAKVEPGRIYLVEAIPLMGNIKAAVELKPINPDSMKIRKYQRLLSQRTGEVFSEQELLKISKNNIDATQRGLKKLEKIKENNYSFPELRSYMYLESSELVYSKLSKEEKKAERQRLKQVGPKAERKAYYAKLKQEKDARKAEKRSKKAGL